MRGSLGSAGGVGPAELGVLLLAPDAVAELQAVGGAGVPRRARAVERLRLPARERPGRHQGRLRVDVARTATARARRVATVAALVRGGPVAARPADVQQDAHGAGSARTGMISDTSVPSASRTVNGPISPSAGSTAYPSATVLADSHRNARSRSSPSSLVLVTPARPRWTRGSECSARPARMSATGTTVD